LNKPETTPPTYFHHIRDGTLKTLKRQMYDRANLDLLERRFLLAA